MILPTAVVLILTRTLCIIPIGEVDSVDDCRWSKVDRPPRISFQIGECTAWSTAGKNSGFVVAVIGQMCYVTAVPVTRCHAHLSL